MRIRSSETWPVWLAARVLLFGLCLSACHGEVEPPPPKYEVFGPIDNFYDVKFLEAGRAYVTSVNGRMLSLADIGEGPHRATVKEITTVEPAPGAAIKPHIVRLKFVDQLKGWGVGQGGAIIHTTDGGKSWERQESGTTNFLFDVDFVDENHGWAVGEISTFLRTSDGGKTWKAGAVEMSKVGIPGSMMLALEDPIVYSVDFLDERTGWVAGEYGQINVTYDGGETWEPQHGSLLGGKRRDVMFLPSFQCVRFLDANRGIAVGTAQGLGTLGGIAFTKDGGATWQFADSPTENPLYDIGWTPDGNSVLVGSSGTALIGNPDTGWKRAQVPPGTYSGLGAIGFDAAGHGVMLGFHGTILVSSDFGKTWERVSDSGREVES